MKSVLISIHPKWCELIANGKKTIEVRKTAPKLQTPFKCYIYCTKPKKFINGYADDDLFRHVDGRIECGFSFQLATEEGATPENNILSGKVIGEFVCDKLDINYPILIPNTDIALYNDEWVYGSKAKNSCLTLKEIAEYGKGKPVYGWHISDIKIYDKPKELGEFYTHLLEKKDSCNTCENYPTKENGIDYLSAKCNYCKTAHELFVKKLSCPPQSWCYVEEL